MGRRLQRGTVILKGGPEFDPVDDDTCEPVTILGPTKSLIPKKLPREDVLVECFSRDAVS